ncbi:hypothetical protein CAPTEDRAFT_211458 [Capitella teleta]|uniref:Endonuclease/exonuclease/phosphatase domain-containing protein n=1 Tax=Capitella teleta TaxID=283909 RepID=R7TVS0_CAPTE|nr:hypothetical protein CAPTEDRAFT_211458 [Capitella teleta]|eukprot:ELT97993.1 hypothetical protein CAPTEDRAFT_211458 [Capitella teleta]
MLQILEEVKKGSDEREELKEEMTQLKSNNEVLLKELADVKSHLSALHLHQKPTMENDSSPPPSFADAIKKSVHTALQEDKAKCDVIISKANRGVAVIDQRKNHNENLLIVLINPWSICNKAEDINDFIIEYNIDILAITETWLTGTACDGQTIIALLPNGYEIIHAPRRTRKGGTAFVYRQSLNFTHVAVSSASFEVLECVIKGSIVLRICVVYQPYTTALFMAEFSSYFAGLATSPRHLLVLGDFNLHVNDPLDKCAQDFLTPMSSLGLEQHVTTLNHRNGHTLDLVLTPLGNPLDLTWKSIDCGFPDHYVVFVQVATSKPSLPRKSHALYSTSFTIVAPRLWNQLPFKLRSVQSLSVFKSQLKTYLLTKCYV